MARPPQSISIRNDADRLVALYIEPEGADYWLTPGDIFDVVPLHVGPGDDYYVFVQYSDEAISVCFEQRSERCARGGAGNLLESQIISAKVLENGQELSIGHRRPETQG